MKSIVTKQPNQPNIIFVLNTTKNVAVLYTIGFILSLTGALTFLGAQLANAMTSGEKAPDVARLVTKSS